MRILGTGKRLGYRLAQTYTTTTTYTVPAGVLNLAFIGIGKGGEGNFGNSSSLLNGGQGGGGGGGGAAIGVWNVPVIAGDVFTLTLNSTGVTVSDSLGNSFAGLSGGNASGTTGGTGGTTIATGTGFLPYRTFGNGGTGGTGGATKTTNGNGNNGSAGTDRQACIDPSWEALQLPLNIYSGYAGGGGGSGARDNTGATFYFGGTGAGGGFGGDAVQDSFALNGLSGNVVIGAGNGGSGGGGGAYQSGFGAGSGGFGAIGNSGIIYVYTR